MKYLLFTLTILLFLFSCNSCDPDNPFNQCENDYVFSIPVTLSPALDTFQIGDTIHISMEFPIDMEEINSGKIYDMSDFPFNVEINLAWIDTLTASSADQDVSFFPKLGEIELRPLTGGGTAVLIKLLKEGGLFKLNIDILLNKAGLLAMGFDGNINKYFSYDLDKDCRNENFKLLFHLNDQTDNNYELLQWSLDEQYLSFGKDVFDEAGGYIFVIEN